MRELAYRPAVLAAALMLGCAADKEPAVSEPFTPPKIDVVSGRPADWPKLEQLVERVSEDDMLAACRHSVTSGPSPRACAIINLDAKTCRIVLSPSSGPGNYDHERMHCMGYDHVGESRLRDWWKSYKRGVGPSRP